MSKVFRSRVSSMKSSAGEGNPKRAIAPIRGIIRVVGSIAAWPRISTCAVGDLDCMHVAYLTGVSTSESWLFSIHKISNNTNKKCKLDKI